MSRAHPTTVAILGDGGWGTTLALHLHRARARVRWWGVFPEQLEEIRRDGENRRYLPGVPIPASLPMVPQLAEAIAPTRIIVVAVPSDHFRSVVARLADLPLDGKILLSVAKGLESRSLKRMSQVVREELGRVPFACLSGPNIAAEIAKGQPASSVVASADAAIAREVQRLVGNDRLRLYTSGDVAGVELGGALKNPIAIAAGIADGLGIGANGKAALVTRGVVEMARLGVAMGAKAHTFWGLSGLGDLITTCLGGRNRWLGEQIGQGRSLREALAQTKSVIEGVHTSRAAMALGRRHRVELPIIAQVEAVLFRGKTPRRALESLMRRPAKPEANRRPART